MPVKFFIKNYAREIVIQIILVEIFYGFSFVKLKFYLVIWIALFMLRSY